MCLDVICVLLTPLCQYLQHVLDVAKMKAQAEEGNEFRNNLVQLGGGVERFYLHLKDRMETRYTCTFAPLNFSTPPPAGTSVTAPTPRCP